VTDWPVWRLHFTRAAESASGSLPTSYREP
jgi:hypothetical protein